MTKAIQLPPTPEEALNILPANRAIRRCCLAWAHVLTEELDKGKNGERASARAADAYRFLMPPLFGYENIRDFIACATHGMLIGAIEESQATKLLYAAQVALATVRRQPASPKPEAAQTTADPTPPLK